MSRMRDGESFEGIVRRCLAPIRAEIGLEERSIPEIVGGVKSILFQAGDLSYRVSYVSDEQSVTTSVELGTVDGTLVADLDEIVVVAGLGARQDVPTNARSFRLLQRTVAGQVEWIRRTYLALNGSEGAAIMRRANARLFKPDG